ncbi:hypothetical protein BLNAU_1380 [Blattamonas nauphoetae]|uniref:Uncharacterized protein n=1 Tax=Blattamonas nauphoetae TaxID=2049346 RepID=A0ABQ9YJ73_9EUKA|nr:hypothetical protein BLNAU_1380 [Blattamonas nauphoetae]
MLLVHLLTFCFAQQCSFPENWRQQHQPSPPRYTPQFPPPVQQYHPSSEQPHFIRTRITPQAEETQQTESVPEQQCVSACLSVYIQQLSHVTDGCYALCLGDVMGNANSSVQVKCLNHCLPYQFAEVSAAWKTCLSEQCTLDLSSASFAESGDEESEQEEKPEKEDKKKKKHHKKDKKKHKKSKKHHKESKDEGEDED